MKPSVQIDVRIQKDPDIESLISLYKEAGWWQDGDTPALIKSIVEKSYCFACAYADGQLAGMGRAISDGVSDAYIQDLAVLEKYRGHGIGRRLAGALLSHLKKNGITWIALISEPGTSEFYERSGFSVMNGYVPMKFEK